MRRPTLRTSLISLAFAGCAAVPLTGAAAVITQTGNFSVAGSIGDSSATVLVAGGNFAMFDTMGGMRVLDKVTWTLSSTYSASGYREQSGVVLWSLPNAYLNGGDPTPPPPVGYLAVPPPVLGGGAAGPFFAPGQILVTETDLMDNPPPLQPDMQVVAAIDKVAVALKVGLQSAPSDLPGGAGAGFGLTQETSPPVTVYAGPNASPAFIDNSSGCLPDGFNGVNGNGLPAIGCLSALFGGTARAEDGLSGSLGGTRVSLTDIPTLAAYTGSGSLADIIAQASLLVQHSGGILNDPGLPYVDASTCFATAVANVFFLQDDCQSGVVSSAVGGRASYSGTLTLQYEWREAPAQAPLPATALLIGAGLLALGMSRRRRR